MKPDISAIGRAGRTSLSAAERLQKAPRRPPFTARWRNAVFSANNPLTSTQRLVALALCAYADADGGSCYPSEQLLSQASALSIRAVRNALGGIESAGYARRQKVRGRGQGWQWTKWTLTLPLGVDTSLPRRQPLIEQEAPCAGKTAEQEELHASCLPEQPASDDSNMRHLATGHGAPRADDLERAPRKSNLDKRAVARCARFDEFWSVYPKKVAKADAQRVWERQALDSTADEILEAVRQRAAGDRQWQDRQFVPNPATYLRGRRWTDEWTPHRGRPAANDSFRGKTYIGTPAEQLPPEFRTAFDEAEQQWEKEHANEC
jgi:hypothetical protein